MRNLRGNTNSHRVTTNNWYMLGNKRWHMQRVAVAILET